MALQWYNKKEIVKEKSDEIITKIGRFMLTICNVQNDWIVTLWVRKWSGSYFRMDFDKTYSLKTAMEKGEDLLRNFISIKLDEQAEKKSHSGEEVKVIIDGEEHTAIIQ